MKFKPHPEDESREQEPLSHFDSSASSPLARQVLENTLIEVRQRQRNQIRRRCQCCAIACVLALSVVSLAWIGMGGKILSSQGRGEGTASPNAISISPEIDSKKPPIAIIQTDSKNRVARLTPIAIERVQPKSGIARIKPVLIKTSPDIASALVERIDTNELMSLLASRGGGVIQLSNGEKIAAVMD